MVRPRGLALAASSLACAPAARGRTGRPGRPGSFPARLAGSRVRWIGGARPPLRGTAALERLAQVVDQLAGLPIPASVLERDVLPARISGYQPRLLDELGALGEVAWVGRGSLGRDDGRIALVRPGREILRPVGPPDGTEPPMEPRHVALREHLATRGASFYRELFAVAKGNSDREVLDALWDLVWAGEVTNDTFAPAAGAALEADGERGSTERRPGAADGAWPARGGRPLVIGGARARTRDGHGTTPRPEPRPARAPRRRNPRSGRDRGDRGWVRRGYPVLRAMEDAGRIRRGYFVDGLGAAQFALAGALDRLRAVRDPAERASEGEVHVLAAADPANPYGAALPWPRRGESDRRRAPTRRTVHTSYWSTESRRCTSSAVAPRCRRSPPVTIRPWRSRRPVPSARSSTTAASGSWSCARSMAKTWRFRRSGPS